MERRAPRTTDDDRKDQNHGRVEIITTATFPCRVERRCTSCVTVVIERWHLNSEKLFPVSNILLMLFSCKEEVLFGERGNHTGRFYPAQTGLPEEPLLGWEIR